MRNGLLLLVVLASFGLTVGAAPAKKQAAPTNAKKEGPVVSSKQKSAAATLRYKAKRATPVVRGRGRSPQPVVVARRSYGQVAPTGDRYSEIQQALVQKGYLQGEPTPGWGAQSTEALKRFQKDQNLPPTGRITSLSLIALGLGPKRDVKSLATAIPTP